MASKKKSPRNAGKIAFRPIEPKDKEFLCRLYASTRQDEMAMVPWDDAQKEEFLTMQFEAQYKFYDEQFKQAKFDIVQLDSVPIGRLYVDRRADEIRIIDIAILPDYQKQGLGSGFLKNILDEADRKHLPVRIHVENNNPARRLYDRLGFQSIGETGVYHLMERFPKKERVPNPANTNN